MALIATPGAADANSFLTVARADAIAAEHPFASAWTSLTSTPTKEALLIMATRIINYRLCYEGAATYSTQSLKFPRTGLLASNGYALGSTTIPLELELATFELALMLATSNVTLENSATIEGLTRVKAGPVELEFKDNISFRVVPENVKSFIPESWLCPEPKPEILFQVI